MRHSVLFSYRQWLLASALLVVPLTALGQNRAGGTVPDVATVGAFLIELRQHPQPEKVAVARRLGFQLISAGRFQEAWSIFEATLQQSADDQQSLYGGALALFNLKQIPQAKVLALRAVDRAEALAATNQHADALVLLGVILAVEKDIAGALSAVRKAAKLAPSNFDAQLALGRALYSVGDLLNAALAFREAARLRPADLQSRFFLATTLEASGDYDQAQSVYAELIRLQPEKAEGYVGLGVLLAKLDSGNAEAIAHLSKAVSLNGDLYEARLALGRALIRSGRADEALPHLERAAQLAPHNPEPHYQLSIAYRRLGNSTAAASASNRVKEINRAQRGGTPVKKTTLPPPPQPN